MLIRLQPFLLLEENFNFHQLMNCVRFLPVSSLLPSFFKIFYLHFMVLLYAEEFFFKRNDVTLYRWGVLATWCFRNQECSSTTAYLCWCDNVNHWTVCFCETLVLVFTYARHHYYSVWRCFQSTAYWALLFRGCIYSDKFPFIYYAVCFVPKLEHRHFVTNDVYRIYLPFFRINSVSWIIGL